MEVIEAIKKRRSVRKYVDKPIPKEILVDIVDCGRLAPSGNNSQPWEFLVVTDKKDLEFLSKITTYGKFIKDGSACIITFCEKNNRHHLEDGSAATENMILAAFNYGIGTCWIAGYNRTYEQEILNHFKVPENLRMISILSLGYFDFLPPTPYKRPLDEVLHWESF
ncbi:MAG: nitroreductase family protein [Mesoaciditoga sp.]|uniref:nitroreductase family protein n=1 Tax=Athalassotoga sp. TaxID=2022597 RepID=UPI000CBC20EF|nr:MAG: nitroreductase family protein [Mesoaciditoga sp.]PMP80859.1 MAG: nitroreductase family protein [Mesoaciditoga sp.]HEU24155.1 nitroreductase family protein [Mesoaciditoga lauensis]